MNLQQILKELADDSEELVSFRASYSGRGMFGKQCVGITGTRIECQMLIGQAIISVKDQAEVSDELDFVESVDKLMNFQMDSMGYDVILYWEGLDPLSEEESTEEE